MNQDRSTDLSNSAPIGADAISRRAYEIWEREGRPDGCDLRHWLEAEQELREQPGGTGSTEPASNAGNVSSGPRNTGSDVRPLQGTRAAAAANRENKRGSAAPFSTERNPGTSSTTNPASAARRKPSNAPAL